MLIYYSALFSLSIQFITGGIDTWGLGLSIPDKHLIFKDILTVELTVQIIEAIFYMWLISKIKTNDAGITKYRYFDWFITTPTMLITLMAYLNHNKDIAKSQEKPYRIWDFFSDYKSDILVVIGLNALMMLIGLAGELGLANVLLTAAIGFIPFVGYFWYIWKNFVAEQPGAQLGHFKVIFWYFVGFWSLYGVAAVLPHTHKNVMYNILDIFAKNVLGVILVYIIWKYHKGDWK
jgi:bacteriorhodopsin